MLRNILSVNYQNKILKELPKGDEVTHLAAYNEDGSLLHVIKVMPEQVCTTGLANLVPITEDEYAQAMADVAANDASKMPDIPTIPETLPKAVLPTWMDKLRAPQLCKTQGIK